MEPAVVSLWKFSALSSESRRFATTVRAWVWLRRSEGPSAGGVCPGRRRNHTCHVSDRQAAVVALDRSSCGRTGYLLRHSHPAQPLLCRRYAHGPVRDGDAVLPRQGHSSRSVLGFRVRRSVYRSRTGDQGQCGPDSSRVRGGPFHIRDRTRARRCRPDYGSLRPDDGWRDRGAHRAVRPGRHRSRRSAIRLPGLESLLRRLRGAVGDGPQDPGLSVHAPVHRYNTVLLPLAAARNMGAWTAAGCRGRGRVSSCGRQGNAGVVLDCLSPGWNCAPGGHSGAVERDAGDLRGFGNRCGGDCRYRSDQVV